MGLSLRRDTYYAACPDGVYVLTHSGSVSLKGPTVARLLDLLAPYLDGTHTLADLTEHLPARRRELVRKLIALLVEQGLVRELPLEAPPDAGGQVTFLSHFRPDPAEAFQRYRATRLRFLAPGRGPEPGGLLGACVRATRLTGLRDIELVGADALLSGPDGPVVHVADEPDVERAELVDRLCAERGIPLTQVVVVGRSAWLGPVGAVPERGRTWSSGWLRLSARPEVRPADRLPVRVRGAEAAVVAGRLAQSLFRTATGLVEAGESTMVEIDLTTLAGRRCPFLPHPFTLPAAPPTAAGLLRTVAELERGAPLSEEEFSTRAASCARDPAGVVSEPDEHDFAQVPLHVSRVRVFDPVGTAEAITVTGAGLGFALARYRAVLRALAAYASLMADPRRLVAEDGRALAGPGDDLTAVLGALRRGDVRAWAWGVRVGSGEACRVPAADAFPGEPRPGAAAAYSWAEAVTAGVIALCHRLTVEELAAAEDPFPRVPCAGQPLDPAGGRYLAMLAAIRARVELYDVTGSLGVPAVLCRLEGEPVGCASALSSGEAVTAALEQALLHYQARQNGQADYAPPPVPDVPAGRCARPAEPVAITLAQACAALERGGRRVVAVPLDHDPEVFSLMPYLVRVVLADG
ncbi:YcaO-like family protein [Nonomuraea sp. NPDC050310]|uniref:YcaO-like family protein n=1 Tax=Nonomuraea sp. NPDC050310 TaxID=3154935 RepID=UPI0033D2558F